ncbi:hypothetical protein BUALT_Bualt08G0078500 [Buddleja alternifolia]|uniref:Secreted protein n=1 Tax=Buddleja alternifolia TaxID=168488 RepID=A0AAV6X8K3_9LAMI|nr:hypothetical protein BUALT_Bualt08G0078500 [Buddleja alternifolia]
MQNLEVTIILLLVVVIVAAEGSFSAPPPSQSPEFLQFQPEAVEGLPEKVGQPEMEVEELPEMVAQPVMEEDYGIWDRAPYFNGGGYWDPIPHANAH